MVLIKNAGTIGVSNRVGLIPKTHPYSAYPPPLPLATTDFTISVISPFFFLECNLIVSIYFATFYDWLLSFSDVTLRFLQMVFMTDSPFLTAV